MTGDRRRVWNEETQRWENPGPGPSGAVPPPQPPQPPLPSLPPEHPPYEPESASEPISEPTSGLIPEPTFYMTSEPALPPPTTPSGGGGWARQRRTVTAAVALVVLAGAGYGTYRLTAGDGHDGSDRAGTAATAPPSEDGAPTGEDLGVGGGPTTDSGATSASPSPSGTEEELPAGYLQVDDPAGYSLAVPEGWERTDRDSGVFYATADDRNLLQIFVVTEPELTPYEAVRQSSKNLGAQQPGYEEVSLDRDAAPDDASPAVGDDAARLVYAYDSEKLGTRKKCVEYAFTADDGKKYAMVAAGPEDDWSTTEETARVALAHLSTDGTDGLD